MPSFQIRFANCHNLFAPGTVPRGPATAAQRDQKIQTLSDFVGQGGLPDLLSFCEVGDWQAAQRIVTASYEFVWSGFPAGNAEYTGLMMAYRPEIFRLVRREVDDTGGRPKWMAALFQLRDGSQGAFWLVVNHWKSNLGGGEEQRIVSARQIGELFLNTARVDTEAMILIGDFNCEPMDRPFYIARNVLRGSREHQEVLRDNLRLAYFYNPMWRFLGEPAPFEIAAAPGHVAQRPLGTYHAQLKTGLEPANNYGWKVWDHLLVTKAVLRGPFLRLREGTISLTPPPLDCTDHCAVSGVFDY